MGKKKRIKELEEDISILRTAVYNLQCVSRMHDNRFKDVCQYVNDTVDSAIRKAAKEK